LIATEAVEPADRMDPAQPRADQQPDGDVGADVEARPQQVRDARVGLDLVGEHRLVHGRPDRVQQDRHGERRPGAPRSRAEPGAQPTQSGAGEDADADEHVARADGDRDEHDGEGADRRERADEQPHARP